MAYCFAIWPAHLAVETWGKNLGSKSLTILTWTEMYSSLEIWFSLWPFMNPIQETSSDKFKNRKKTIQTVYYSLETAVEKIPVHQNRVDAIKLWVTLKNGRRPTGEGTLFAKSCSPRTAEYSVVDMRLIREATVYWLTGHHTIPRSMKTLQLCRSLGEWETNTS